jgi:ribonuclease HIII
MTTKTDHSYIAGLDESGKGDLFGTPACACVVADTHTLTHLRGIGVRDCKDIDEIDELNELDTIIRANATVVVKQLSPLDYNALMAKPSANLNKLLAWQHAHALHEAHKQQAASQATLDQFAKGNPLQTYLGRLHFPTQSCPLEERTHAEVLTEVAAASICARAAYLRQIDSLSREINCRLMRGCSLEAQAQAGEILEALGESFLQKIAKMHFKCCRRLLREEKFACLLPRNERKESLKRRDELET